MYVCVGVMLAWVMGLGGRLSLDTSTPTRGSHHQQPSSLMRSELIMDLDWIWGKVLQ